MRRRSLVGVTKRRHRKFISLRSRWGDHSGPVLQALEYAEVMGVEALWRQWCGSGGARAQVIHRLGRHLTVVGRRAA